MTSPGYARIPGDDGRVVPVPDAPPGIPLDRAGAAARPSPRAVVELGAAVADILVAAAKHGATHGDLRPSRIRVAAGGAVVVDGFDTARLALSGQTEAADIDALGRIIRGLLAGGSAETDWGTNADAPWLPEVKRFLSSLVASRPEDRPSALDAAIVLGAAASRASGDGIAAWAARTGAPPAPPSLKAAAGWPAASRTESAGPRWPADRLAKVFGPAPQGPVRVTPPRTPPDPSSTSGPSGRGGRTWMPEEEPPQAGPRPFSTAPTLVLPVNPDEATALSEPPQPRPVATFAAAAEPALPPPPVNPPALEVPVRAAPVVVRVAPTPPQEAAPPPPEPAAGTPGADARAPAPARPAPAPAKKTRSVWPVVLVGVLLLGLLFACLGVGGAVAAWFMLRSAPAEGPVDVPAAAPPIEGSILPAFHGGEAPAPVPTRPRRPAPARPASPGAAATPTAGAGGVVPEALGAASEAAGEYLVGFRVAGAEAEVRCGDGQSTRFYEQTELRFDGVVTCVISSDAGRDAVQTRGPTTVSCAAETSGLRCEG